MPGEIAGEREVPIAQYGRSHRGHFKEVYRRGLQTRYGGLMQAIAGAHYNYSLPGAILAAVGRSAGLAPARQRVCVGALF